MLEVRTLPLTDLVPAPYNPRRPLKPTDRAWRKLQASLETFGLVEPLIWNEVTGHIVGGHLRLAILRHLGMTDVPVSVVRLTPEREKALNVVLNNREAQGRFEPGKLADLLAELEPLAALADTGFEPSDLRALQFEPADLPSDPNDESNVTVTLICPVAIYEHWADELDRLVRTHDLICHVCGGEVRGAKVRSGEDRNSI